METRSDPISTAADPASLTAARAHVQSLSSSDREVLLRALLEPIELQLAEQQPEASEPDSPTAAVPEQNDDPTRLSVSTTASAASCAGDASRVSALSTAPLDSPAAAQHRPTSHASTAPSTRAYWCLSCGKKQSSRSEWKQHDSEQHHHRRRPRRRSGSPAGHRRRAWGCGFCAAFLGSQDRFQDHVALHFEAGKTLAHWHHENVIYGLLHQPAVHEAWKALQAARYAALPRAQRPKMGWDAAVTGRGDGQLQSLLEYFDPSRHSPWDVARLADDLAIRITLSVVAAMDEPGDPAAGSTIPRLSISTATAGSANRHSKWASAAPQQQHIAAALVPQPLKPVASARIVSQPSPPPVAERRPPPQHALENYYDPHPGTRVQIPDFLPVTSEHHPSAVQPIPRHLFGDWDSLASTVVETPRNFSLPCPRHWASTQFLPSGAVA